jgi:DNA-binding transcriptional LysR family regulator
VSSKLADYRLGLYASRSYLERHGAPGRIEDLRTRPLVWYIEEMLDLPELRYLDQVADGAHTVFRSSSIVAQHAAIASGLGLGILHVVALKRSYWLSVHGDSQRVARVRAVIEFLRALVEEHKAEL